MRWRQTRASQNVEDYRGRRTGGGGGGMKFGVVGLVAVIGAYFLGIDPRLVMGLLGGGAGHLGQIAGLTDGRVVEDPTNASVTVSMVLTETDPASPTTPPLAVPTKPSMTSVERAMTLLRQTDRPVTDIAWDVGFASLGTFSRTFTSIVGCAPTEFRAQHEPVHVPSCFIAAWTRPRETPPPLPSETAVSEKQRARDAG